MVSPVFRRQLCMEHLSTPADQGNNLKRTQSLAQSLCPGRAGTEEPKAEQREARPPPTRSPVGCWRLQPLLPHRKTHFSSVSLFTQSLFVHPPRLPSPRQTQHCLAKGQMIFWAAGGGGGGQRQLRRPCHAEMPPSCVCETAQAGQRGLLLPAGKEGEPGVLDAVMLPLPNRNYRCSLGLLSWQSEKWPRGPPQADGHTRAYKFP